MDYIDIRHNNIMQMAFNFRYIIKPDFLFSLSIKKYFKIKAKEKNFILLVKYILLYKILIHFKQLIFNV